MKNLIIYANRLTAITLGTVFVLGLTSGCKPLKRSLYETKNPIMPSSINTSQEETVELQTTISVTAPLTTSTLMPQPTLEADTAPACMSNPIKLASFEDDGEVSTFRWSDDGKYLYFLEGDNWYEYSLEQDEISSLSDPGMMVAPTPPPFALNHLSTFDWEKRDFSLSPSGKIAIYEDASLDSGLPITASETNTLPANFDCASDIFLFQEGQAESLHLGKVVDHVLLPLWFPGEERILLKMSGCGESPIPQYPLYLLDIHKQSLTPFMSVEEDGIAKVRVLDISPDGNWVLYQRAPSEKGVMLKNVHDFSVQYLESLPKTRNETALWLPDGERIVTVVHEETGDYSVYLYNMNTNKLTRIISDLRGRGAMFFRLGLSSNQVTLAYHDAVPSGQDELYIRDLCLNLAK